MRLDGWGTKWEERTPRRKKNRSVCTAWERKVCSPGKHDWAAMDAFSVCGFLPLPHTAAQTARTLVASARETPGFQRWFPSCIQEAEHTVSNDKGDVPVHRCSECIWERTQMSHWERSIKTGRLLHRRSHNLRFPTWQWMDPQARDLQESTMPIR